MDAHILIRCYRALLIRMAEMNVDLGELLPHLPGRFNKLPSRQSLHQNTANECSYPCVRSSMITSREAGVFPSSIKVVDEWADVGSMLEQLHREPFFSFATQAIRVEGTG